MREPAQKYAHYDRMGTAMRASCKMCPILYQGGVQYGAHPVTSMFTVRYLSGTQ